MAVSTSSFKKRLIREGMLKLKCSECGIRKWRGVPAPLQLDHVDGNRLNNMISNIRLLCPNCHALTPTFGGRNRNLRALLTVDKVQEGYDRFVAERGAAPSANQLYVYLGKVGGVRNKQATEQIRRMLGDDRELLRRAPVTQRTKIKWPTDESLRGLLEKYPRTYVAEMLGVSDTAVKKRCVSQNISEPTAWRMRPRVEAPKVKSEKDSRERRREASLRRLMSSHGTRAGYLLERRLDIPTCSRCRAANTAYTKANIASRKDNLRRTT